MPLSKKDTSELIKTEVERLCTPYKLLLAQGRSEGEFAKSKADPQDDSEVIAGLKKELAEAKLEAEALEVIGGSGSRIIVASAMAAQKSQHWQVKPEPRRSRRNEVGRDQRPSASDRNCERREQQNSSREAKVDFRLTQARYGTRGVATSDYTWPKPVRLSAAGARSLRVGCYGGSGYRASSRTDRARMSRWEGAHTTHRSGPVGGSVFSP